MPESQPVQTADPATFVCDCEEWQREACAGESFYAQFGNNRYCILHYPADKDQDHFDAAFKRKLDARDYNFQGVWFPTEVDLHQHHFESFADFNSASFNARARFFGAKFDWSARFENAPF